MARPTRESGEQSEVAAGLVIFLTFSHCLLSIVEYHTRESSNYEYSTLIAANEATIQIVSRTRQKICLKGRRQPSVPVRSRYHSYTFVLLPSPPAPLKPNQDKYAITLKFAGEDGDATFAVFDGHGDKGHDCANFAKKKLPQFLAKYVRQKRVQRYSEKLRAEGGDKKKGAWNPKEWPLLNTKDYEDACIQAFRETNKALHEDKKVSCVLVVARMPCSSFARRRQSPGLPEPTTTHFGCSHCLVVFNYSIPST